MYCNHCGKMIPADANLCAYCGKQIVGVIRQQRLVRPRQGRKVAGVCLGFAEYFDLDVNLIRAVWLICLICAGVGAVAYFVSWIVIPEEPYMLPGPASVAVQNQQNQVTNT